MNSQLGFDFESDSVETIAEKKRKEQEEKEAAKKTAEEKAKLEKELAMSRNSLKLKLEDLLNFYTNKNVQEDNILTDEEGEDSDDE